MRRVSERRKGKHTIRPRRKVTQLVEVVSI